MLRAAFFFTRTARERWAQKKAPRGWGAERGFQFGERSWPEQGMGRANMTIRPQLRDNYDTMTGTYPRRPPWGRGVSQTSRLFVPPAHSSLVRDHGGHITRGSAWCSTELVRNSPWAKYREIRRAATLACR